MTEILENSPDQATYGAAAEMLDVLKSAESSDVDIIDRELAKLSPRTEIDDQGLSRLILERNGITFSFAGRQETPRYATLEQSRSQRLGHTRRNTELDGFDDQVEVDQRQAYQEYAEHLQLLEHQNAGAPEHLLSETSPLGMYLLLARLEPDNHKWAALAEEVGRNEYSDESIHMIDMITAVNALYEAERPEATKQSPVGEALVVEALLGNAEALAITEKAVARQKQLEAEALATNKVDQQASLERLVDVESFKPSDLVVVRISAYEPQATESGYQVQTAHDASGFPRATLHTTLNHTVESHMWGNWDNKGYVLIGDFKEVLAANGEPNSLNGADTWWSRNPGENMQFPNATLVAPGGPQEDLIHESKGRSSYKSAGITESDVLRADEIFWQGATQQLLESMRDEDGNPVELSSEEGQHILANGLRDLLVRREIVQIRGKQYLEQADEKYMSSDVSRRLSKLAAELNLTITGHLHADSDESYTEDTVGKGTRRYGGYHDPKVRRVAYASGFMGTGGQDRLDYLARQAEEDEEGD